MFIDGIPSHKHFCLDLARLGLTLRNSGPSLHLEVSSHPVNVHHDLSNFAVEPSIKRHEHLLPTFLLRYEVYTYENLHRDELGDHTSIFFGNLENSGLITTLITGTIIIILLKTFLKVLKMILEQETHVSEFSIVLITSTMFKTFPYILRMSQEHETRVREFSFVFSFFVVK